jgi:integrase
MVIKEGGRKTKEQKIVRDQLMDYKQKAEKVLETLKVITPDNFKKLFFSEAEISKAGCMIDIESQFQQYVFELKEENRFRSADFYKSALKTFKDFKGNVNLQEIDTSYLRSYELWMMGKGKSRATIMMYCRALRSIFNRCFKAGILSKKFYPFSDYRVGSSKKSKHVLYPHQVKALTDLECENDAQQRAKDYWLASYMSNGMNIADLIRLKWSMVQGNKIIFHRQKTGRTKNESEAITVFIHQKMSEIIDRRGQKERSGYIFPILNTGDTEEQKHLKTQRFKRMTNKVLNRMKKKLAIEGEFNLGLARHSMATKLKIAGVDISTISTMLGHTSITTTQHYVKSLPDSMLEKISDNLMMF